MARRRVLGAAVAVAVAVALMMALAAPVNAWQQGGSVQQAPPARDAQNPPTRQAQDPQQIVVLLDLARMYIEQGRFDEAGEILRRASMAVAQARANAARENTRPTVSFNPGGAPLRVGGDIEEPKKIRDVRPVYPQEARDAGVQGIVILEVTLDELGEVSDARVLRSVPMLDDPALDAVRQWKFTPTLLNGQPVPVIMTVTVNFTLN